VIRPPRLFVLLASAVLLLAGCDASSPAVRIGDLRLSEEELRAEVSLYRFLAALSGAPCGSPVVGESEEAACVRFTLTNVIQEEAIASYAEDAGVSEDAERVADAISQLEQNLGGPAELDGRLEDAGVTREQLRSFASRLILIGDVREVVIQGLVDEDELREAYEQQLGQFTTVEVSHVLLQTREEAERVARRADADSFARLARRLSQDPGSAGSGGNLGAFSESQFLAQFDPDFTAAALALEPGGISGPVRTQFGWHVIRLLRHDVAAFDEVRDQLVAQQGGAGFAEWLDERYRQLVVEVNPRYGRLDPETHEVVAVRSTAEDPEPVQPAATGP